MQGKVGGEGLAWERDNISDNIGQYSAGQYRAGGGGGAGLYKLLRVAYYSSTLTTTLGRIPLGVSI